HRLQPARPHPPNATAATIAATFPADLWGYWSEPAGQTRYSHHRLSALLPRSGQHTAGFFRYRQQPFQTAGRSRLPGKSGVTPATSVAPEQALIFPQPLLFIDHG